MRPITLMAGLALTCAAAPAASWAACPQRTTGTVVGAVAGGLLGNAVAGHGARTEGTLLGAAAGGLVGNQVTKCPRYYSRSYSSRSHYRSRTYPRASYERPRYAEDTCRYESRPYYDAYGEVVYQPMRVCGR
jgi:uncharacterized protein YcfJ